jgi:cation:H+ antiporter
VPPIHQRVKSEKDMAHAFAMMLVTGAAVVVAGILLGWSADRIANATGLGEMWTGWVLLAGATSLPEFVTDTSAVRIHAANLAGGDLFGSSLTNMAILAVLALSFASDEAQLGDRSKSTHPGELHSSPDLFNAGLAIVLTIMGTTFTLLHTNVGSLGLRPESLSLLLIWIAGTRILYKRQQSHSNAAGAAAISGQKQLTDRSSVYWPILIFAGGSAIIFLIAPAFANCARQFAAISGWGDSFVGTWLLGSSTALPEFVTSITACRLGAFDLAVANLYGSCAFNMVVFFMMDLASPRPVFSLLDPVLALSGALAVVLMLLGVAAVALRRHLVFAPTLRGGVLLASYGVAIWIIYSFR